MNTIKLTEVHSNYETLVNLDNVMYAKVSKSSFGDEYSAIYFSNNLKLEVVEKITEIEDALVRIN